MAVALGIALMARMLLNINTVLICTVLNIYYTNIRRVHQR